MDKPDLNFLTAEDAENAEGNYALVNFFPFRVFHARRRRAAFSKLTRTKVEVRTAIIK